MDVATAERKVSRQQQADEAGYQERQTEDDRLNAEDANAIKEYLHELRFQSDRLVFNSMVRPYTPMQEALDYFGGDDDVTQKELINLAVKYYDKDKDAEEVLNKYFYWKLEQSRNW